MRKTFFLDDLNYAKQLSNVTLAAESANPNSNKGRKGSKPHLSCANTNNASVNALSGLAPSASNSKATPNLDPLQIAVDDDNVSLHPDGDEFDDPEVEVHDGMSLDEDIYGELELLADDDQIGAPLGKSWAAKVNECWKGPKPFTTMKTLYDKYKVPENCTNLLAPQLNPEIWALLKSKWQKKCDLQYAGIQKTLVKVSAAILKLNEAAATNAPDRVSKVNSLQVTTDALTMLNQASYEISLKRKSYLKSVLKPEYHGLCSSTKNITSFLFGDDLAKDIKEYDIKKKLTVNNASASTTYSNNPKWGSSTYGSNRGSFLGKRRGRGYRRPNNNYQKFRPRNQYYQKRY